MGDIINVAYVYVAHSGLSWFSGVIYSDAEGLHPRLTYAAPSELYDFSGNPRAAPSVDIFRSVGARLAFFLPFIEKFQPLVEKILKTPQTFLPLPTKFLI